MKTIPSRFVPVAVALAVAVSACLAAATVVQAQTPAPGRSAPGEAHPPMPPGPHGGMHMMREVERLKKSLQLNAQQTALWDRAAETMKPPADMHERMKGQHDRMTAMLDDPNFDPRKMAAEMDRMETERHAKMTAVRDAWFAVYDSLNPAQRGQVREFLRERMSHHEHGMHEGMHGRMEWHHDGEQGRPPMAPPTPGTAPAR